MIVMKFGGSSVKDAERISEVFKIVKDRLHEKPILVCSAMGKTTDNLLAAGQAALSGNINTSEIINSHKEAAQACGLNLNVLEPLFDSLTQLLFGIKQIKEISPRTKDYLVSFGERLAVRIVAGYFNKMGLEAKFFDAWDIGILTDSDFTDAKILPESYARINESFRELQNNYTYTPIVTGFLGKEKNGEITTLGRGGSDLTAAVIGAGVKAKEIQVWKDVSGLMTADPKKVKGALPVQSVTFDEAAELAYFGAKVLHPLSMAPAKKFNIPVRVKNSYQPEDPGTLISDTADYSRGPVKSITVKNNITLVDITSLRMLGAHGFLAKVFDIFEKHEVCVDTLASSEVSVSLTVYNEPSLSKVVSELEEFASVKLLDDISIVSIISDVNQSSVIFAKIFEDLAAAKINVKMISQGASKVNISMVMTVSEAQKALPLLHESLLELYREAA